MTLPANGQGLRATRRMNTTIRRECVTNLAGAAVAGRGLITKITHNDTPTHIPVVRLRCLREQDMGG